MSERSMRDNSEFNNMSDVPREQPAVARELTALSNHIADLDQAINNLCNRIQPALGPMLPMPIPEKSPGEAMTEESELTRVIGSESARVLELFNVVVSITNRVEL